MEEENKNKNIEGNDDFQRNNSLDNLPPPELPYYEEVSAINNSQSNENAIKLPLLPNNESGYSSTGSIYGGQENKNNLEERKTEKEDLDKVKTVTNISNNSTIYQSVNLSNVPSNINESSLISKDTMSKEPSKLIDDSTICKPCDTGYTSNGNQTHLPEIADIILPDNRDFVTLPIAEHIQKDPIHSISKVKEEKIEPLIPKQEINIRKSGNLSRYCNSTFNKEEILPLIINIALWIWFTLVIMSYIGIIHFPRGWGSSSSSSSSGGGSWDFSGIGSGSDAGAALVIILLIILIILLIVLMPYIYPEFILIALYLAYLYLHYDKISFYSSRSKIFSRKVYRYFLFLTFAEVYILFARCCYDI